MVFDETGVVSDENGTLNDERKKVHPKMFKVLVDWKKMRKFAADEQDAIILYGAALCSSVL